MLDICHSIHLDLWCVTFDMCVRYVAKSFYSFFMPDLNADKSTVLEAFCNPLLQLLVSWRLPMPPFAPNILTAVSRCGTRNTSPAELCHLQFENMFHGKSKASCCKIGGWSINLDQQCIMLLSPSLGIWRVYPWLINYIHACNLEIQFCLATLCQWANFQGRSRFETGSTTHCSTDVQQTQECGLQPASQLRTKWTQTHTPGVDCLTPRDLSGKLKAV